MTIEEKAKAYDEVLEKAKNEINAKGIGDTVNLCKFLFPQLCESEDERIRKELIEFIKWSVDRHFMREDFHQAKRPSEWIAYLEKQKEQKSNIELIKRAWYMEGYKDREYNRESKWIVKTGEDGPRYEENQRHGQSLEQKSTELSEDERIMKAIIQFFKDASNSKTRVVSSNTFAEWAIYLEKYKGDKEELVYRLNGLMQDYIKEGKDEEEKEHRFKCYQLFWDALEDADFFEQKEQKSIESIAAEVTKDKESAIKFLKSTGIMDDNGELAEMYRSEQKPAEWSEKDKIIIEGACNALKIYGHTKLASMLESISSQPKQEWSEEDEDMAMKIDCYLSLAIGVSEEERQNINNWLKSLRPQLKQEWDKKDKKILQSLHSVMNCADAQNAVKRDGLSVEDVCEFLFSIEPCWKPSKEQLEALLNTLHPDDPYYYALKSLYEQLQKL